MEIGAPIRTSKVNSATISNLRYFNRNAIIYGAGGSMSGAVAKALAGAGAKFQVFFICLRKSQIICSFL